MKRYKLSRLTLLIGVLLLGGCNQKINANQEIEKVSQEEQSIVKGESQETLVEEEITDTEYVSDESILGIKADSFEEEVFDEPISIYEVTGGDNEHVVTTVNEPVQSELTIKDLLDYPEQYIDQWITLQGKVFKIIHEEDNYAVLGVECNSYYGNSLVILEYYRPEGAPRVRNNNYIVFSGVFKGLVNDSIGGMVPNIEAELAFKGYQVLTDEVPTLQVKKILDDWATGKRFVPNVDGDILKCFENGIEVWGYSFGFDHLKEKMDDAHSVISLIDSFESTDIYQNEEGNIVVIGYGTLKPKGEGFIMEFIFTKEGELVRAEELMAQ